MTAPSDANADVDGPVRVLDVLTAVRSRPWMYFPAPLYGGYLLRSVFPAVHAGARAGLVSAVMVALDDEFVRVEWSGDGRLAQLHPREREPGLIVATTVLPLPLPPDDYSSGSGARR